MMTNAQTAIDAARRDWEDGARRLHDDAGRTGREQRDLETVVTAIQDEIVRQTGQNFSMRDLVHVYETSDAWCRRIAHEQAPRTPVAWQLSIVQDAAFHDLIRQARDYRP